MTTEHEASSSSSPPPAAPSGHVVVTTASLRHAIIEGVQTMKAHDIFTGEGKDSLRKFGGESVSVHEELIMELEQRNIPVQSSIETIIASLPEFGLSPLCLQLKNEWALYKRELYRIAYPYINQMEQLHPGKWKEAMSMLTFETVFAVNITPPFNYYAQLSLPTRRWLLEQCPILVKPKYESQASSTLPFQRKRKRDLHEATVQTIKKISNTHSGRQVEDAIGAWLQANQHIAAMISTMLICEQVGRPLIQTIHQKLRASYELGKTKLWPSDQNEDSVNAYHKSLNPSHLIESVSGAMTAVLDLCTTGRATLLDAIQSTRDLAISEDGKQRHAINMILREFKAELVQTKEKLPRPHMETKDDDLFGNGNPRDNLMIDYCRYCHQLYLEEVIKTCEECVSLVPDPRQFSDLKQSIIKIVDVLRKDLVNTIHDAQTRLASVKAKRAESPTQEKLAEQLMSIFMSVIREDALNYQIKTISDLEVDIQKMLAKEIQVAAAPPSSSSGDSKRSVFSYVFSSSSSHTNKEPSIEAQKSRAYDKAIYDTCVERLSKELTDGDVPLNFVTGIRRAFVIYNADFITKYKHKKRDDALSLMEQVIHDAKSTMDNINRRYDLASKNLNEFKETLLSHIPKEMRRWETSNGYLYNGIMPFTPSVSSRIKHIHKELDSKQPITKGSLLSTISSDAATAIMDMNTELKRAAQENDHSRKWLVVEDGTVLPARGDQQPPHSIRLSQYLNHVAPLVVVYEMATLFGYASNI